MSYLNSGDIIGGQEARCYLTIDGRVEELFYAKKLEAKIEKKKSEIKALGKRVIQHKATGWNGSGTLTIYYMTSLFREIMLKYVNEGIDTYFDISVVNEDPGSTVGKQTVVLKGVNLDSVPMAMFDVGSEGMEEEISFTFEDVNLLDKFGKPVSQ